MGLFGYAITACTSKECFMHNLSWASWGNPLLYGKNNVRRKKTNIIHQMATINDDTDENDIDSDGTRRYTPPKHSEAFLRHLESVQSSWPYNDDTEEGVADETKDNNSDYSVYCTGEPSIDPSRMLQSISDDDYDWI